jgi:hypothetical protein
MFIRRKLSYSLLQFLRHPKHISAVAVLLLVDLRLQLFLSLRVQMRDVLLQVGHLPPDVAQVGVHFGPYAVHPVLQHLKVHVRLHELIELQEILRLLFYQFD